MFSLKPLILYFGILLNLKFSHGLSPAKSATLRPPSDGPLEVKIGFFIESIGGLKARDMSYTMDLYFRMSWVDPRLVHNLTEPLPIHDLAKIKRIWRPDLYFMNAREAEFQMVTTPNFVMYVDRNGTVAFSVRITLTASCHMDLHYYPMDNQLCTLKVSSYAHTLNLMNTTWFERKPVLWNKDIDLPEFEIESMNAEYCDGSYEYAVTKYGNRIGKFSCLLATISLSRSVHFHLVQTYIPMALIVIISFVAFFIDRAAVPARITLSFTSLLTITTQGAGVRYSLPPVSYAKAIDYWFAACLVFVFGGLVEYAIVNSYMLMSQRYNDTAAGKRCPSKKSKNETAPLAPQTQEDAMKSFYAELAHHYSHRALKIDKISRIAFPVGFGLFVALYSIYYQFL